MFKFYKRFKTEGGRPYPLGATVDLNGVNFSIYSKNATSISLHFYNGFGHETQRFQLKEKTDDVWHIYIAGAKAGQRYAYRVDGAWQPENGLRFNKNKLLLDPAAKLLTHNIEVHKSQFAYQIGSENEDLSFSYADSAPFMPKCIVVDTEKLRKGLSQNAPNIPWDETVIYETHLRGFTKLNSFVSHEMQGKFLGLTAKKMVQYLRALGITSVELLPTAAFANPLFLKEKGLKNYWGYDPVCFMAPQPEYLHGRDLSQIQTMVRVLHEAGIEVILDVVFNHTGEGNQMGPSLCLRGIDNTTYYRLSAENPRYYMNDTGCGNMLNFDQPATLSLVLNAMRYWVELFEIDGFRFDLATTLGRTGDGGYSKDAPFFKAISQDNILSRKKLIAEPWDIGWSGYQYGHFPNFFAEWNDKFRDACRRFWKGDLGQVGALFTEFAGVQYDKKPEHNHAWRRINYLTAHDGFTAADLVSYNEKHNEQNGEENRDGNSANWSWNSGVEGQTNQKQILDFRLLRLKAMMATLLLSNGTPMLLAGDEFLNTQFGNNNAYAQDNPLGWLSWKQNLRGQQMLSFVKDVLQMRKEEPLFGDDSWVCLQDRNGIPLDIHHLSEGMRDFGFVCQTFGHTYFVIMNASDDRVLYQLKKDMPYQCLLDTAQSSLFKAGDIEVGAWTMVVLKQE